jgi:hypothetical protein
MCCNLLLQRSCSIACVRDIKLGLQSCSLPVGVGNGLLEVTDGIVTYERNGTSSETSSCHPAPYYAGYLPSRLCEGVQFLSCHFVVIPQRLVALVHQLPESSKVVVSECFDGIPCTLYFGYNVSGAAKNDKVGYSALYFLKIADSEVGELADRLMTADNFDSLLTFFHPLVVRTGIQFVRTMTVG